eukprot:1059211-Pleurochrysis_carterae.AAC.1
MNAVEVAAKAERVTAEKLAADKAAGAEKAAAEKAAAEKAAAKKAEIVPKAGHRRAATLTPTAIFFSCLEWFFKHWLIRFEHMLIILARVVYSVHKLPGVWEFDASL